MSKVDESFLIEKCLLHMVKCRRCGNDNCSLNPVSANIYSGWGWRYLNNELLCPKCVKESVI